MQGCPSVPVIGFISDHAPIIGRVYSWGHKTNLQLESMHDNKDAAQYWDGARVTGRFTKWGHLGSVYINQPLTLTLFQAHGQVQALCNP